MAKSKGLSESCDATLRINGSNYEGSTGQGNGHAEMDALHNFIMSDPGGTGNVKLSIAACAKILKEASTPKAVYCPSRPCCLKCTTVLKGLKFKLASGTKWSEDSMGSTEWGVSMNVRTLLIACEIDYESVKGLS